MRFRILTSLFTLIILSAFQTPAFAHIDFNVELGSAPPPAYVQAVPSPRPGYVWSDGYWAWRDGRYFWIPGYWIEERPGYVWYPEHWEHNGERWHLIRGGWRPGREEHREEHREHIEHERGDRSYDRRR